MLFRSTLATTERYKDKSGTLKEQTEWHNIVCWRALAEFVEKYLKKGTQIYVEGKLRNRSYTDKEGNTRYVTEIVADSIQLLGRKSDNQDQQHNSYQAAQQHNQAQNIATQTPTAAKTEANPFGDDDESDDLPF